MAETLLALGLISSNNSTERHLPAPWLSLQTHQKRPLVKNYTGGIFFKPCYAIQRFSKFAGYYVIIYKFMFFYALSRQLYPKWLTVLLKECISSVHAIPGNRIHDLGVLCTILWTTVLYIWLCFSQKIGINIIMRVDCVHSCAHALTSVLFWRIPLFCVDLLF